MVGLRIIDESPSYLITANGRAWPKAGHRRLFTMRCDAQHGWHLIPIVREASHAG